MDTLDTTAEVASDGELNTEDNTYHDKTDQPEKMEIEVLPTDENESDTTESEGEKNTVDTTAEVASDGGDLHMEENTDHEKTNQPEKMENANKQEETFSCHRCDNSVQFCSKKLLFDHYDNEHNIGTIKITQSEEVCYHVDKRNVADCNSCAMENIKQWISSSKTAAAHIADVISGKCQSSRHNIFLDRQEWRGNNPLPYTVIYQLSNQNWMGEAFTEPKFLQIKAELIKHFKSQIDTNSKLELADLAAKYPSADVASKYCELVLFPETVIHYIEVIFEPLLN